MKLWLVFAALVCSGCFEAIEHGHDGGLADSGETDGGTDAGTCSNIDCACAQACTGSPAACAPVTPSTCDATTHCDTIVAGSTCTAVMRFGSFCGYHACQLPDGGP